MEQKTWKIAIGAALMACLAAPAAMAGGDKDTPLMSWAKEASAAIDDVMVYPAHLARRGKEGQITFRVTIDDEGEVVSMARTAITGARALNSAAKRVIERADWPALTADMDRDTLTFAVQLNYETVSSMKEYNRFMRQPRVTTRQLASTSAPLTASIRILNTAQ